MDVFYKALKWTDKNKNQTPPSNTERRLKQLIRRREHQLKKVSITKRRRVKSRLTRIAKIKP